MKNVFLCLFVSVIIAACGIDCDKFIPVITDVSSEMLICFDSENLQEHCSTVVQGESKAFYIPVAFAQNSDCTDNPHNYIVSDAIVTSDSDLLLNNTVLVSAGTNFLELRTEFTPFQSDGVIFLSSEDEFILFEIDPEIQTIGTIFDQESAIFNFQFIINDTDTYSGSNTFVFNQ